MKELTNIQEKLKAPKSQYNSFGKYHYRNCEDILEAVKPLLAENNASLTLSDEIVEIGGRIYVKATATFIVGDKREVVSAYAREPEVRKGMDESQITGASSSYARKYALNGLFCIDDTKDPDNFDNSESGSKTAKKAATKPKEPSLDVALKHLDNLKMTKPKDALDTIKSIWRELKEEDDGRLSAKIAEVRKELGI